MAKKYFFYKGVADAPSYLPLTTAFLTVIGIPDDGSTTIYGCTGHELWVGVNAFEQKGIDDGWLAKMVYLYLFIGGSASLNKFNFMNPADSDAAYRLTFSGGWTHDENGSKANGTNAEASTHLDPVTLFATGLLSFGRYNDQATKGAIIGGAGGYLYDWAGLASGFIDIGNSNGVSGYTRVYNGFVTITRANGTQISHYGNGTKQTLSQTFTSLPSGNILIGGNFGPSYYSDARFKMTFFSAALSDAEELSLRTANAALQTVLNRL
jgi:hypothetical protein